MTRTYQAVVDATAMADHQLSTLKAVAAKKQEGFDVASGPSSPRFSPRKIEAITTKRGPFPSRELP